MSLIVQNLTKSFGPKTAVDQLNFQITQPGVYGLIGTNGAGKTTTIRMILDMLPIDHGSALWNGKTVKKSGLRYGYMPEERGIYAKTRVLDQLVYFGRLRGLSKSESIAAAKQWMRRLAVTEYERMPAEKLSKGNQQKIQLISTLIHDPQLIFLDEPFSGLDPLNSQLFHELISEMANSGKTIIMSSHQMATVEQYCREITLLHRGHALVQGNLADIKRSYGHTKLVLGANEQAYAMAEQAGLRVTDKLATERAYSLRGVRDSICAQLLRDMLAKNIIPEKFVLSEPTLHEIFIDKVASVEGSVVV